MPTVTQFPARRHETADRPAKVLATEFAGSVSACAVPHVPLVWVATIGRPAAPV
jgi:hypothetical protein